jgi:hypothetical protein
MSEREAKKISRREFLRLAGATGAGFGVGFLLGRGSRRIESPQPAVASPTSTPLLTDTVVPIFQATPTEGTQVRVTITPDTHAFDNFLPTQIDSLGGTAYKEFLGDPDKLIDAWTVEGSIYAPWYKTETLESVKYAPPGFLPRWSVHEEVSLKRLDTPKIINTFGRDTTAVILDSGGAHSLAMAYELARDGGWQPVPMLRGIPCKPENCATFGSDQDVAVALYPAEEMLDVTAKLPKTAPPVFICNTHRSEKIFGKVDNSYSFTMKDVPDAIFLVNNGIKNIIYVNEANDPFIKAWENNNSINADWVYILNSYQKGGINVQMLGISPSTS